MSARSYSDALTDCLKQATQNGSTAKPGIRVGYQDIEARKTPAHPRTESDINIFRNPQSKSCSRCCPLETVAGVSVNIQMIGSPA